MDIGNDPTEMKSSSKGATLEFQRKTSCGLIVAWSADVLPKVRLKPPRSHPKFGCFTFPYSVTIPHGLIFEIWTCCFYRTSNYAQSRLGHETIRVATRKRDRQLTPYALVHSWRTARRRTGRASKPKIRPYSK